MSESSPRQIHAQELAGVLTCWFRGAVLQIKLPRSQTTITLPLLMLNKQGKKVGFTPQLFAATPWIYCSLFVTPSLFVL